MPDPVDLRESVHTRLRRALTRFVGMRPTPVTRAAAIETVEAVLRDVIAEQDTLAWAPFEHLEMTCRCGWHGRARDLRKRDEGRCCPGCGHDDHGLNFVEPPFEGG